jgi:hypothetical protein
MSDLSRGASIDGLESSLAEYSINDYEELLSFHQYEAQRNHRDNVGQGTVVASGSRSLVEALCHASVSGLKITSIRAQNCGVAFLATDLNTSSLLRLSIRHIRSLSLQADLVSNDTFMWDGSKLILPTFKNRQQELHRAITSGLLGLFIAAAEGLEELDLDLQCHEIYSLQVEESDLINFLGNYCWSQLRWLRLRGIWTSEGQLLDLLSRHRGSLKYLDLGDVVLKKGTWRSFFKRLKKLVADSHITARRFQLGGDCLASWTEYSLEGRRWKLDSVVSPGRSLRDCIVEFNFRDGTFPSLHEISYEN